MKFVWRALKQCSLVAFYELSMTSAAWKWQVLLIYFVTLIPLVICYGKDTKSRSDALQFLETNKSPPNYDGFAPTVVECDLDISSVDSINEAEMDFTVGLIIHLQWVDNRLLNKAHMYDFDYIDFDAHNMEKIWVPDIYFPNEKKAKFHKIMVSNKMLRLFKNETVSYNARLSVTLSCKMDLRKYPFDKQVCSILIESFGYTSNKLLLKWSAYLDNPVSTHRNIRDLPQFRVLSIDYDNYTRHHNITGNHSCLQADFHLIRNIGYYVIQMYIPSLLIVMLSWLSFWLNVNSVPGRVSLGVLSVLTISTQSSAVNASLPRVSYTKAIDIWMITCLVFVFAALIEFAVVNVLSRKIPGRRFSLARLFLVNKDGQDDKEIPLTKETTVDPEGQVSVNARYIPKSRIVMCSLYLDVASRVLFPLAFGAFNIIYWVYFLNVTEY